MDFQGLESITRTLCDKKESMRTGLDEREKKNGTVLKMEVSNKVWNEPAWRSVVSNGSARELQHHSSSDNKNKTKPTER